MATGDVAARMALVLVQSLRDVGTHPSASIIVLLFPGGTMSPDCPGWMAKRNRQPEECSADNATQPEAIISWRLVKAFRRLGAELRVTPPIPRTPYTVDIPGGASTFWGMALNKLTIFKMTEFEKVIWMDGDTMALRNLDHLWKEPSITGSITTDCCDPNGTLYPAGGLWILEPSMLLWDRLMAAMTAGLPQYDDMTGAEKLDAPHVEWTNGDQLIVRHVFSNYSHATAHNNRLWPWIADSHHGHAVGLQEMPMYRDYTPAQMQELVWGVNPEGDSRAEQAIPAIQGDPRRPGFLADTWDGVSTVWHALPLNYDMFVVSCECMPWRHTPFRVRPDGTEEGLHSVHFSCMRDKPVEVTMKKPADYESEAEFWTAVATAPNCYRVYWSLWHATFVRAFGGGLGGEWAGPPPVINYTDFYSPPTVRTVFI